MDSGESRYRGIMQGRSDAGTMHAGELYFNFRGFHTKCNISKVVKDWIRSKSKKNALQSQGQECTDYRSIEVDNPSH